ncbi:MAG: pyridoxal-phosphate dependent enzyme, partial [Myxococcota bacterium]|nr:pyridoxal-phosphate dependent enzyme [Myxococcota bacterium]
MMRSPLIDLCPRLDRSLRPLPIVSAPTPVERLDGLSSAIGRPDLWAKRDDRTSPEYGGNKVRKLAFLLAHAIDRDRRWIVTAGMAGSSHLVATALYASRVGLRVAAAVCPQPAGAAVRANLGSHAVLGTELHPVGRRSEIPAALARVFAVKTLFGQRPTVVLPGGSSPTGTLGCVDAGIEFARQVAEGSCPEPAAVVVPFGSGGTAAGLALGFALAGLRSEVIAVRTVARGSADGAHRRSTVRTA